MATVKGKKADVSSVSPSSERLEELWVVCGFICRKLVFFYGARQNTDSYCSRIITLGYHLQSEMVTRSRHTELHTACFLYSRASERGNSLC